MANEKDRPGKGKAAPDRLPAGATNLKKNRAVGMGLQEAEDKALTKSQVEAKER